MLPPVPDEPIHEEVVYYDEDGAVDYLYENRGDISTAPWTLLRDVTSFYRKEDLDAYLATLGHTTKESE